MAVKKEICSLSDPAKETETIVQYLMCLKNIMMNLINMARLTRRLYLPISRLVSCAVNVLHRWLAKVVDQAELPPAGELNDEEYDAAIRFVERSDVSAIMFRPGNLYIEQQISDKNNFGIVDRMIVSDDLITIIDYKSGSMRGSQAKIR